ncbi:hypothetical protein GOP47_0010955 [Adiantum capillus-veneris]|uniref:Phospholipid/glycerol acyltransferase domain-containing protein n=1 Tax=Adiantum capillus-veneris TaxID=13818 RepID=A0A9D4ZGW3_ADICA|nr:hypothetical protein GOP47_0010955 [Adiantum capillus-veneris]
MADPNLIKPDAIKDLPTELFIAHLEGTLLREKSFFPYYMLVALEAGGPLRALFLLLMSPLIWVISICISLSFAIQLQAFIATTGLKMSEVRAVAVAVLPKFFLEDLEPAAYRAFLNVSATCGYARCVITSHPKLFVEYFLRTHLRVDVLLASELEVTENGNCTGFFASSRNMISEDKKLQAVDLLRCGDAPRALYALCVKGKQHGAFSQCQETTVVHQSKCGEKVSREEYLSPLVFHDGRLVIRPTPLTSLAIALWMPLGFALAIARMLAGRTLPQELAYPIVSFLGLRLRVRGAPPLLQLDHSQQKGVMYVAVHRTLADPTFVTMALRRKVRGLSFSVSKISEFMTPIHTTRLTRNREEDAKIIKGLLEKEDLCVCPEGTTCREPFLLRFSPLFAELADWVVPVAVDVKMSLFHGTSARGYKFMDGFFLAMNPTPSCEITFLEPICALELRKSGKSAIEIANLVQKQLAGVLGYEITNFKRKDKYFFLAGHDGNVQ